MMMMILVSLSLSHCNNIDSDESLFPSAINNESLFSSAINDESLSAIIMLVVSLFPSAISDNDVTLSTIFMIMMSLSLSHCNNYDPLSLQ